MWLAHVRPNRRDDGTSDSVSAVREAYDLIRDRYLGDLSDQELQQGAIRGMVERLDGSSSYVPPGQLANFNDHMRGLVDGFGLKLEPADGAVVVVAPLFGSPAQDAGILPGDRVVAVDGQNVATMTFEELQAALTHPRRQDVELKIVRAHRALEPIRLRRRQFKIETVTGLCRDRDNRWVHLIDADRGLAYVRLSEFVTETTGDFHQAFRGLSEAKGMILDLRDNPGGLLPVAIEIADLMLAEGPIVTVWSPRTEVRLYSAHPDRTTITVPVVVLVDNDTASAAEIVAGALQNNARAVLVGQRTRGKASVQTMFPLSDGMGQINITTCRYVIGDHDDPAATHTIEPDVTVEVPPPQQQEVSKRRWVSALGPAVLGASDEPVTAGSQSDEPPPGLEQQIATDPQLSAAVELLRTPGAMENLLQQRAAARASSPEADTTDANSGY